ncbi:MAG: hypothetical protein MJ172_09455 [Clostridia bacterium]|nr:hypothetical protein [Clostridia bacterium]
MENEKKITWVLGDIKGLYIDFKTQTIGYHDKEIHLEFLQCQLIDFMLTNPSGFVTTREISESPELFSVNLSKYISDIKKKSLSLIQPTLIDMDPDQIFDLIIEKKTVMGRRGYRIRTELTDIFEEKEEESNTSEVTSIEPDDISEESKKEEEEIEIPHHDFKDYLQNNWMPLFIFVFILLSISLLLDATKIHGGDTIAMMINMPFAISFFGLCLLSMLPIIAGIYIDVPISCQKYAESKGISSKDLKKAEIHDIAMYKVPRFDNSKQNVTFFAICNITGAFALASEILYVKSIPGLDRVLLEQNHDVPFFIMAAVACFVALFNNYALQTKISPIRYPDDFMLSNFHAFFNTIWLSLSIFICSAVLYTFASNSFFYGKASTEITSSYVIMFLSILCYLWFSSDSPGAEQIDSISKNNFISGAPIMAVFSTIYTLFNFKLTIPCLISLILGPCCIALQFLYLSKHKKSDSVKMYQLYTSFFSIMAICVILILIISAFI